jgi:hypothetical protein
MPVSRKAFVSCTMATAGVLALPVSAVVMSAPPFRGAQLIQALKAVTSSSKVWHHGQTHAPYLHFADLPGQGTSHTGGFPCWDRIVIGKDGASGRWLAAIPMACGGTAGVTVISVFAESTPGPTFVGVIRQGHKQCAYFADGALHVSTPVWGSREPNAFWSKTRVGRYALTDDAIQLERDVVIGTKEFALQNSNRSESQTRLDATTDLDFAGRPQSVA